MAKILQAPNVAQPAQPQSPPSIVDITPEEDNPSSEEAEDSRAMTDHSANRAAYQLQKGPNPHMVHVKNEAFYIHLILSAPESHGSASEGGSQVEVINKPAHKIMAAKCVVFSTTIHSDLLTFSGQGIARQALAQALMQEEGIMTTGVESDPGRIVCGKCSQWDQQETAEQYLCRLADHGAISVSAHLQIHVTGANMDGFSEYMNYDPLAECAKGIVTTDALKELAYKVSQAWWVVPKTVDIERDGLKFSTTGASSSNAKRRGMSPSKE
jgi:hypothetical protein